MYSVNRFLTRSWVYPFYKTYSGVLFVVFLIVTGFLRGEEHMALAVFFTSHIKNMVYPYAILVLYESLTIHFSIKWLSDPMNRIIRELVFLDFGSRLIRIFRIVLYLHIPVMIYSIFLLGIAVLNEEMFILSVIIVFAVTRIFIYTLIINHIMIYPVERQYKGLYRLKLPAVINFPIVNFSVKNFFTQKFVSFLLSKLFSIGILMVFIFLFDTIDNFNRFSRVSIALVFIANVFLSYDLFKFHNIDLHVFRNLPVKPSYILLQTLMILVILILPEIILIYKYFSRIIDPPNITIQIINGLSITLFLYAYLMYFSIDLKTYIMRIFWGSILLIMILLIDFPIYLLFILLCSGVFYFYFKGYYKFELIYNQVNDR